MQNLDVILLGSSNEQIEEKTLPKPITFEELNFLLKEMINNLPENYHLFFYSENKEININNNDDYKFVKDVLFVRENENIGKNLQQSIFSINYNKLSESKKEIIDNKYECPSCLTLIKNESPYFCDRCHKIFHTKCLKIWEQQRHSHGDELNCPSCRYELSLKDWKKKTNFEQDRLNDAILLESNNSNLNGNCNEDKLSELENKNECITSKNYEFSNKADSQNNYILQENNDNHYNSDINEQHGNLVENTNPSYILTTNNTPSFNYSNEITLTYYIKYEVSSFSFFGEEFVLNNRNNIELIVNDEKCERTDKYKLKEGLYYVKMIIKNKLTNLKSMFQKTNFLINIDNLKFLDTSGVTNFSNLFQSCGELSDIKSLKFWDVSNGKDFSGMFQNCYNIYNIKPLEKWNVTKGKNFSNMFSYCNKLSDIKPLKNWNISNCEDLSAMFCGCESLKDISPIKNWNVSNVIFFQYLFSNCPISNLNPLKNWDISNGISLSNLFEECSHLTNLEPIRFWDLSNCADFSYMFCGCSSLLNIKPLENWNVRKGNNFSGMFKNCSNLLDIRPVEKWDLINGQNFNSMFYGCSP